MGSMMASIKYRCRTMYYILLSLFGILCSTSATEPDPAPIYSYCNNTITYKPNSRFEANLNALLSSLASNAAQNSGYYNDVKGWGTTDSISGQFLCRGDVNSTTCKDCVTIAAKQILSLCPNQTESIVYYDSCMLRYTNQSFKFDSVITPILVNTIHASDQSRFDQSLGELLRDVAAKAASNDKRFATQEVQYNFETLYGLGQCMPDLTRSDCSQCFKKAIADVPSCCEGAIGARVLLTGCNIRYEIYRFYDVIDAAATPEVAPTPSSVVTYSGKRNTGSGKVVAIVVPVVVSVILFGLGSYFVWRRRREKAILRENFGEESSNLKSLRFNLATIEAATNKFSLMNRIGKGGFGEVYKGILQNGQEIAVKRLSKSSGQGVLEFKNEVLLIANLQHRNLVALLGFCLEEQEKILIYEYVPNKSIDFFLFDSQKRRLLNWPDRFKIISGISQGLLYLHEYSRLKIIHRDLKPSNILLDSNMNPKISDFGMARMVAVNQDQGNTNRIVGTYGYMSPEYLIHGQFSEKLDVFSFGVIILEVISGKRNVGSHESHLLTDAWKQWNQRTPLHILDPFLIESCSEIEVTKCVHIGLLCVQENPDDRPTMAQIVSYLSNLSIELPFPREPAFFMHNRENPTMAAESGSGPSSQSFNQSSTNEMSKSELLPR